MENKEKDIMVRRNWFIPGSIYIALKRMATEKVKMSEHVRRVLQEYINNYGRKK